MAHKWHSIYSTGISLAVLLWKRVSTVINNYNLKIMQNEQVYDRGPSSVWATSGSNTWNFKDN